MKFASFGNILNLFNIRRFAASSFSVYFCKHNHQLPSYNMSGKFKYNNLAEVITDGNAKFSKYQSQNSGITVCIAQVNGPLVGGYFAFATEAFDNDGLPHTLEHLVFMGSEKYPYKGVLDLISNRCLSQGTNAWTATDHTCYTVSAAGDEGFLKFLPIYLDHLLFPTLTDAAYTTEVHHINGEGEDAGVVYCEMQGRENSGESLCYYEMLCAMYPGHCGYKQETGGKLKNLRESTSNEKVKAYHKEFYRPENLCLIIVGQVEAEKVFEALIPVEERIAQEGERNKFVRPWHSPVPPLTESITREIEYPTDEEEYGILLTAWRGPLVNDFFQVTAIQVLLDYLTDTSVAPLNRDLIEIEDPLCNDVDYTVLEFSVTGVYMYFSSVPVKRLNELKEKLFALLKHIADGKEMIDMQRMTTLIKKKKLYILSTMEDNPHDAVADSVIGDFLYGSSVEDLENRLKEIPIIDKLFEKDAQFWVDVLKNYFVNGNHVIVKGIPSSKLSDKLTEIEKARIKVQIEKLGPDGLENKAKILNNAIAVKEIPPPTEVLTSVSIPSVKSIKFHPIKRTCNVRASEGDDVQYSVNKMPCRFEVDAIQTNFVRLFVLIDTSHLSLESRMFLPLLIELLDECAINRDGKLVPYQEVVKELAEDTISVYASLGFGYNRFLCASYSQIMLLNLMVEEDKYEKSVQWINEMLYKICFEPSRVKSTINKLITDIPTIRQSGSSVVKSMMKNLVFRPDSNHWTSSLFRQHNFLTKILKQLETNSGEIIQKLNEIRDAITKPDKMVVHMALNLNQLKNKVEPEDVWIQKLLPSTLSPCVMSSSFKKCSEYLQPFSDADTRGLIAGLGSIESSFLQQTAKCSLSRDHPDYAPLMILNHYLTMTEGPMWRSIRGSGLAYSFGMWNNCDTGLIYFILHKSCDLVKAYEESISIVESHLSGTTKWDMTLLESSVSSVMSELIEQIKTISDVVSQSVRTYCRDSSVDFTKELQELLEKVCKVTTTDMERVGMQYLKPLFNSELSKCTIACNPAKVKEITEGLKKFNRDLTVVPSLDDSFMSKY